MDNKQHFSILKWNAKIAQLIQVMLGKEKGKKKNKDQTVQIENIYSKMVWTLIQTQR